jgi:hypothetical protein
MSDTTPPPEEPATMQPQEVPPSTADANLLHEIVKESDPMNRETRHMR